MNKRIKKMWVNALRSGKYKQGKGALCIEDAEGNKEYCCLGVLCDLAMKSRSKNAPEVIVDSPKGVKKTFNGSMWHLPNEVVKWADLESNNPHAGNKTLSYLNDADFSFEQIADKIEQHL